MANESSSSSPFNLQTLLLIAAGLGVVLFRGDMHPFLPSEPDSRSKDAEAFQLDSHIVGGPLPVHDAGGSDRKAGDTGRTMLTECAELQIPSVEGRAGGSGVSKICIMPVVVRGDFRSAESRETRIRIRFAVASGLGAYGLVPDDSLHLLVTAFNPTAEPKGESASGTKPESTPAKLTPMEWFAPQSACRAQRLSGLNAVLVVWVKSQSLEEGSLSEPLNFARTWPEISGQKLSSKMPD